jgi:hypothetical protein
MLAADAKFARHRSIPAHVLLGTRSATAELRLYRSTLEQLYNAIRIVSGCSIIVDSTKRASYAYLLRDVPGLDLRVVHLVRDSRGVAYSNTKTAVARPEVGNRAGGRDLYMPSQSVWRTALNWQSKNMLFYGLVPGKKRRLVKYENLVREPDYELREILQLAGAEPYQSGSLDPADWSFDSAPHHTLGGNPVRFKRGRVKLKLDDEWRTKMTARQRLVVVVMTFPLLLVYGYLTSDRVPRPGPQPVMPRT